MTFKTITQQRDEKRIFAGNDTAHTATGSNGIATATPALTPLMLEAATGKLVAWDGKVRVQQWVCWFCRWRVRKAS